MTRTQLKWGAIGVGLLVVAALKFLLISWYWQKDGDAVAAEPLNCVPQQGCELPGGGRLLFTRPPRQEAPFEIRVDGVPGEPPSAEFAMPAMDMGFNRYRFVADGGGWRATVTLPVCATGARDWLMTLEAGGRRYTVPFRTQ
ncbi:hypothetical protein EV683_11626 [Crenobacter luteus]|uniref:hypothetical protein n=1 Tax=Crenobacter luteus TaxID=1452487 RepID=UPI00104E1BCE|nr:hypothetical protein [Crenobacter luteus]TCP10997.1 hypothetical protein EV683_11626 [Crenobacter luteus]